MNHSTAQNLTPQYAWTFSPLLSYRASCQLKRNILFQKEILQREAVHKKTKGRSLSISFFHIPFHSHQKHPLLSIAREVAEAFNGYLSIFFRCQSVCLGDISINNFLFRKCSVSWKDGRHSSLILRVIEKREEDLWWTKRVVSWFETSPTQSTRSPTAIIPGNMMILSLHVQQMHRTPAIGNHIR